VKYNKEVIKMNPEQLRELITEVLQKADLYSPSAVELLMLTAAAETRCGKYIKQINGPALGIFQMEPATHADIWKNYLRYHPELVRKIRSLSGENWSDVDLALKGNLIYQILLARIHYLRDPKPLPPADDIEALAQYYKRVWNTYKGKATVQDAIMKYYLYAKENGWRKVAYGKIRRNRSS